MPPTTIEKWWERSVRLDRNLRQSRVEEKVLGGKEQHGWQDHQKCSHSGGQGSSRIMDTREVSMEHPEEDLVEI